MTSAHVLSLHVLKVLEHFYRQLWFLVPAALSSSMLAEGRIGIDQYLILILIILLLTAGALEREGGCAREDGVFASGSC